MEEDAANWKGYNEALHNFRVKAITHKTELKGSFGQDGYESLLFEEIIEHVEELHNILWVARYASEMGSTTYWAERSAEERSSRVTAADQGQSRTDYFAMLERLHVRIAILSTTMIHCIQNQFVGNLRGQRRPDEMSDKNKELLVAAGSAAVASTRKDVVVEQA
jgi:hypothetical protein